MMEKINVKWGVNQSYGSESIPIDELSCSSIDEWNDLSVDEQRERMQIALDELPERVWIIVEKWD